VFKILEENRNVLLLVLRMRGQKQDRFLESLDASLLFLDPIRMGTSMPTPYRCLSQLQYEAFGL
jgi:hypothetical protein